MRSLLQNKLAALAGILLLLYLGVSYIHGLIMDRQTYRQEAFNSIQQGLAGQQHVVGPVLVRECSEQFAAKGKDDAPRRESYFLRQTPDSLNMQAEAVIEPRYRGIFRINSFVIKGNLQAHWDKVSLTTPASTGGTVSCGAARIAVNLADPRGIRSIELTANGQALKALPGSSLQHLGRGFHADLSTASSSNLKTDNTAPLDFNAKLEFVGLENLALAPIANDTRFELKSDWQHPSFVGNFLPLERRVDSNGFSATWKIPALATNAPQQVGNTGQICPSQMSNEGERSCIETLGVGFIDPVNNYALSDRASKYGMLFILLTFVGVWLMEILRALRVHPFQYLLTGAALAVFFLLLVGLSEHLNFSLAYALATLACVALLAYYARFMLGDWRRGGIFGAAMLLLYGLLYLLLQLEQTAFLVGSLIIFAVLALLMITTSKVDWYALAEKNKDQC